MKKRLGPTSPSSSVVIAVIVSLLCSGPVTGQENDWRTIEIETTEVTSPDVAVSPDGSVLVFSLLGQLFSVPTAGGTAFQLTSGPFYHYDPSFAPDGRQLAFVSDRDGSEGNVFAMDLETREITQLTHEVWVGRPAWSPDGRSLVYLSYAEGSRACQGEARAHELDLESNAVRVLGSEVQKVRSVFYTTEGQVGWSVAEGATLHEATSGIVLLMDDGSTKEVASIIGAADRVVPNPTGHGFYVRRERPWTTRADVLHVSEDGAANTVADVSRRYCQYRLPQFAVAPDGRSLFIEDLGKLWRVSMADGEREEIPFRATVRLVISEPTRVARTRLPRSFKTHAVSSPRLTPDGRAVVFGALGFLWKQPLAGGPAERLTEDRALERGAAMSPDGRRLAYLRSADGRQEIRVLDLESGVDRTIYQGPGFWDLSWHPGGEILAFATRDWNGFSVATVDLADATAEPAIRRAGSGFFSPRPHFSADGQWVYYRFDAADTATIQRLPVWGDAEPEPMVKLPSHLAGVLVSPDERWLAFRRNRGVWIAPLDDSGVRTVSEEQGRQLSPMGGAGFAITPDARALIYSDEGSVWIHSLAENTRREVPVNLVVDREVAPPLLLRRVRVLDVSSGTFGKEVSMFVDGGRISWIDSEGDRDVPSGTRVVDAEGRYAIPGLIDMHNHAEAPYWGVDGYQSAHIAYGVTTVRDMGEPLGWVSALAERSSLMSSPVPRYLYPGDMLQGRPETYGESSILVRSEDQVRSAIRRHKDAGVSFIKVYHSIPWPLQLVAAEETRRHGLPVAAHGMIMQDVVRGVTHGYAFLEHLGSFSRFHADVQQLLAMSGTYWTPTLAIMGARGALAVEEPERLADAKFCAFFPESCRRDVEGEESEPDSIEIRWYRMLLENIVGDVREARTRGVNLLVGTDRADYPGYAMHIEMESFVRAGFAPLEVLKLSTQGAATALGVERDLGTLEPDKLADIVLLEANPLEDIRNTQNIWRVIKGGWVYDPEYLRPQGT
jgi:imidazolonepropionase-like amidohydrolase/Tol biopolymer transport system component